jgi:divalent metal cation (Fe/Co/Zn/Cd) transporter
MAPPPASAAVAPAGLASRESLVRRAKRLAWLGMAWHWIEAVVAIAAGIAAGSIALIGFGIDSVVEAMAGFVLLWRFAPRRSESDGAERRAQQLIGMSFYLLAAYVAFEAVRGLATGERPDASTVGIVLAAATLLTMPPLARAKAQVAHELRSSATRAEGRQNLICAYLAGALLVGLSANAALGWWWADPLTALVIAAVAVREGRVAWRGEACC